MDERLDVSWIAEADKRVKRRFSKREHIDIRTGWHQRFLQIAEENQIRRDVFLGQDFPLFDPICTRERQGRNYDHFNMSDLVSPLRLHTGGLSPFPLDAIAEPTAHRKKHAITPYNPEDGYRITGEDFDIETRVAKFQDKAEELDQIIDRSRNPLCLEVSNYGWELDFMGYDFYDRDPTMDSLIFKPELLTLLTRLRLRVQFPNGLSFESMPWPSTLSAANLQFSLFYPLDAEPLSSPNTLGSDDIALRMLDIQEGLRLKLSYAFEKLSQLRGMFTLLG